MSILASYCQVAVQTFSFDASTRGMAYGAMVRWSAGAPNERQEQRRQPAEHVSTSRRAIRKLQAPISLASSKSAFFPCETPCPTPPSQVALQSGSSQRRRLVWLLIGVSRRPWVHNLHKRSVMVGRKSDTCGGQGDATVREMPALPSGCPTGRRRFRFRHCTSHVSWHSSSCLKAMITLDPGLEAKPSFAHSTSIPYVIAPHHREIGFLSAVLTLKPIRECRHEKWPA